MNTTIKEDGKVYNICLIDDGTLDTVVSVNGEHYRFDSCHAYRSNDGSMKQEGFDLLANDALDLHLDK